MGDVEVDRLIEEVFEYDGLTGALRHDRIGNEGYVVVNEFFRGTSVETLFHLGSYAYKQDLHISM